MMNHDQIMISQLEFLTNQSISQSHDRLTNNPGGF
jgi:hypothetical protein